MKISEIMPADEWAAVLDAADGNVEKAKVMVAIGWHETHWGRLGWGRYGYHMGVGAYSANSAAPEYKGLDKQLAWTTERLGSQESYSLEDLQWYGREIQRPTSAEGINTGNQWGQSVYSIYRGLVVDYEPPAPDHKAAIDWPDLNGAVQKALANEQAMYLAAGMLLLALALLGVGRKD